MKLFVDVKKIGGGGGHSLISVLASRSILSAMVASGE